MKWILVLALALPFLGLLASHNLVVSQEKKQPLYDIEVVREKLMLPGWDPAEPVPAYAYYQKGGRDMPVVIFMHGMRGSKEGDANRMKEWAANGLFVLAIDAHLHGERKIPGVTPQGKNPGA